MWQEADFKLSFNIVLCVGLPGAGLAWIHGAIREGLQSHSLASWRPHFSERAPDRGASQLCRWKGQKYNRVGAPELFLSSLCLFNFYISAICNHKKHWSNSRFPCLSFLGSFDKSLTIFLCFCFWLFLSVPLFFHKVVHILYCFNFVVSVEVTLCYCVYYSFPILLRTLEFFNMAYRFGISFLVKKNIGDFLWLVLDLCCKIEHTQHLFVYYVILMALFAVI